MLEEGITLLIRFRQEDRISISQPRRELQVKFTRQVGRNEFVVHIDGIGELGGRRCLREWKTSASRYPEGRKDYWLSLRNWSAIPGRPASPMSRRLKG